MSLHPTPVPTRDELQAATSKPLPKSLTTISLALAVIGAVVFVAGLFMAPDRAWHAWHFNWLFFAGLSSGGVTIVAVQRITTARWSRPVVRILEGYVAFLPVAFVFLLISLFAGRGHIFPWIHDTFPSTSKAAYFSMNFLVIRDVVTFAVLTVLPLWFVYKSVRLDVGQLPESGAKWAAGLRARMRRGFGEERRELHATHSITGKLAVAMAITYAVGWSLLAWDLSMTLSMHFQSDLYSWWFFMGAWLSALMAFTLLVLAWRRYLGADDIITEKQIHDIGKLCFAFTAFWGYLTFGQYLVIWYGNMGEQTFYMRLRLMAPWKLATLLSIWLVFVLPFFGLITKMAKMYLPTHILFAVSSLVGLWLMCYVEVYPSAYGVAPSAPFGIWELGVAALYLGLWGLSYVKFMDAFPRMRLTAMTSAYRDEIQVPVDPKTLEPLPAHE
ncbi:MAG: hypothetical protein KGL93_01110 [Gemmatimonadota bacterium]|nr:hypothetical protein [Gemmatimonadota bacterium]HEU4989051.1 hypothetical protein [Gemmatimonadaceae bacterium]